MMGLQERPALIQLFPQVFVSSPLMKAASSTSACIQIDARTRTSLPTRFGLSSLGRNDTAGTLLQCGWKMEAIAALLRKHFLEKKRPCLDWLNSGRAGAP